MVDLGICAFLCEFHSFSSARLLFWCFPMIWSCHLTFFFDEIWLIVGGVGTGDLKMGEFFSLTGFGLEFLVEMGICTFLCEFWSFTGFGLKFLVDLGICAFLCEFWSSTEFGLEFLVALGICTFLSSTGSEFTPLVDSRVFTCLSSTELGLRTEVRIFDI